MLDFLAYRPAQVSTFITSEKKSVLVVKGLWMLKRLAELGDHVFICRSNSSVVFWPKKLLKKRWTSYWATQNQKTARKVPPWPGIHLGYGVAWCHTIRTKTISGAAERTESMPQRSGIEQGCCSNMQEQPCKRIEQMLCGFSMCCQCAHWHFAWRGHLARMQGDTLWL